MHSTPVKAEMPGKAGLDAGKLFNLRSRPILSYFPAGWEAMKDLHLSLV